MSKRYFKCVLALVLFVCIFLNSGIVGYACLYPPSEDGKDAAQLSEDNDIRYWHQGVIPPDNSDITPGNGKIGSAACSSFAMTYCLVKMGIYHTEDGDGPIKLIEEGRANNLYSNGWYFDYCNIGRIYPEISCINDFDSAVGGLSSNDALNYVKGLMAEGKYVIACVNGPQGGHMIFFDGITDDGKVSIGDSAFAGLDWETTYGAMNATMQYVVVFEYDEDSTERPSIYDEVALRQDEKADAEDIEVKNTLVEEYDLLGMPAKYTLQDALKIPHCYSREDFNVDNLAALRAIKDSRDLSKTHLIDILRIGNSILGTVLLAYSLLLVFAYWLDEFSPIHISMLSIISFGGISIVNSDRDFLVSHDKNITNHITRRKFIVIVLVVFLMGVLMVSGKLLQIIYAFVQRGLPI